MPRSFDVFNGDADGICALLQLRKAEPRDSTLVTGVKRDINLLRQVEAQQGDRVTVLDISMDKNTDDLQRILSCGASVLYVDHHFPGEIPNHHHLDALINENANTCTSVLVNGRLKGAHIDWAIAGAFGDNLHRTAHSIAATTAFNPDEIAALEKLGTYINYNGYGPSIDDLHFAPDDLYRRLYQAPSALAFVNDSTDFTTLAEGYQQDMQLAADLQPVQTTPTSSAFILPNAAWARRVSGVYSNDLTSQYPDRAHAVITAKPNGHYLVSVRAPLNNKQGAVELCRQFPTGGGRAAAAGINDLPAPDLQHFIDKFSEFYSH
jgi:hypothetical protein